LSVLSGLSGLGVLSELGVLSGLGVLSRVVGSACLRTSPGWHVEGNRASMKRLLFTDPAASDAMMKIAIKQNGPAVNER